MSYAGGWRPHIESALCLDVRDMLRTHGLRPGCQTSGALHWTRDGDEFASVGFAAKLCDDAGTLELTYAQGTGAERKTITCTLALESLPCHYGGRRWFACCPYTHRRAWKLYKWPGIDWFCHRDAIKPRPTYASQRVSGADRINAQRWELRRKLGDNFTDLFSEPWKPKWMRWRTFQRYADRDAELSARDGIYTARLLGRMGVPGLDAFR